MYFGPFLNFLKKIIFSGYKKSRICPKFSLWVFLVLWIYGSTDLCHYDACTHLCVTYLGSILGELFLRFVDWYRTPPKFKKKLIFMYMSFLQMPFSNFLSIRAYSSYIYGVLVYSGFAWNIFAKTMQLSNLMNSKLYYIKN